MRNFSDELNINNHQVIYIKLVDENNLQSFEKNIQSLIAKHNFTHFEYQLPDEYRVDVVLTNQLDLNRAFSSRFGTFFTSLWS
jgi:deoxyribodipyrimidine photolyase-related protein